MQHIGDHTYLWFLEEIVFLLFLYLILALYRLSAHLSHSVHVLRVA